MNWNSMNSKRFFVVLIVFFILTVVLCLDKIDDIYYAEIIKWAVITFIAGDTVKELPFSMGNNVSKTTSRSRTPISQKPAPDTGT